MQLVYRNAFELILMKKETEMKDYSVYTLTMREALGIAKTFSFQKLITARSRKNFTYPFLVLKQ